MCAHPSAPAPFFRLPPELCEKIFIALFRSTTIRSNKPTENSLAVLSVCRQFYCEASPLLLRNVQVYCHSNAAVIETLIKMSPAQIAQLRHLIVRFIPVGFNLFQQDARPTHSDGRYRGIPNYVRYFHLGAVLGLFPGLQLDLLEVYSGVSYGATTPQQVADCLGTLLEADGYRDLWMEAAEGGDGYGWGHIYIPSMDRWKDAVKSRFWAHGGTAQLRFCGLDWRNMDEEESWVFSEEEALYMVKDEEPRRKGVEQYASEDGVPILLKRGDTADIVVKPDDRRVLRCIDHESWETPESYFKDASDALRRLLKEETWESIKAMDGFDGGGRLAFDIYSIYRYFW